MGLAIARVLGASDASRKPSAPLLSRWLASIRQGGWSAELVVSWRPPMRIGKLTGRLIHSPPLPESVGSPLVEAKCAASCSSKG